jgi:hypothetical protein
MYFDRSKEENKIFREKYRERGEAEKRGPSHGPKS